MLGLVGGVPLSAARAQSCPDTPDHRVELQNLFDAVRGAPTEGDAQQLTNKMWALWTDAPDEVAQSLLDAGMSRIRAYDYLGALHEFDRLIAYCPAYAEGYNQRAYVHYLRQDFAKALPDLDSAIALSPNHVGALSGKALTLFGLQRHAEAQDMLGRALELNPWLPERGLLQSPPVQKPQGQKI